MLNPDFRDMLSILNEEKVEYLVVTEISGVTFEDAYPRHTKVEIEGVSVPIIGRQDLLLNKKAAGRPQDLADAAWLENGE